MNLDTFLIGCHGWFARDGDAFLLPAPGVVGREAKPQTGPALDGVFIDMGNIEDATPAFAQEETKLWKPAPGRLVLYDIKENKQELSYKVKANQVSPFSIEAFFRTTQKLGGAQVQFNPASAVSRKGWVHFEKYDENDAQFLTLDLYCRLRCTKMNFDGKPTMPEYDLFVLYSSLNTGATA